ncbi:MAG: HAMP domain-containing histidine kinase [Saprospiraceae bacterium]|nr:HAMP domain-containing histidine kinase [Saprospiraceae bacterium]
MNLYSKSGRWKTVLIIVGLFFVLMPLFYSNYLGIKLSELEHKKIELFEKTLVEITNTSNLEAGEDVSYELEMLYSIIEDLQLLVINRNQNIDLYNFPTNTDTLKVLNYLRADGPAPLISDDYTIYYSYPFTLTLLRYFPLVQFFLLMLYAAIGYGVFNASRREEQNRVWVGMAKETAHQLGTPISGMIGWLEALDVHLKDEESKNIVAEMGKDIDKLQLVADRFSKIGSTPELVGIDLPPLLRECMEYIQARASKNIQFSLTYDRNEQFQAAVNANLFSWVLENILRNALDAMDQYGKIDIHLSKEAKNLNIEISDTGKGIAPSKRKEIFKPGYTTKKRGWGLGLSLSRRIIENYHKGKIYVKASEPGKGTIFFIQLPRIS